MAGMTQFLRYRGPTLSASTTPQYTWAPEGAWESTHDLGSGIWCADGTFSNLTVFAETALTGGNTLTCTIYKNGSATGVTVTLDAANQSATDSVNSVAVSDGDTISLHAVGNASFSAGALRFSVTFVSTTDGEHCHTAGLGLNHTGSQTSTSSNIGVNPFFPVQGWASTLAQGIVAADATITRLRIRLSQAVNVGSRTFTLVKNGVLQDGSGGTPDTRVVMTSGTSATSTFSLSVSAGDNLYIRHDVTSTPTTAVTAFGLKVVATTNGESTVNVRGGGTFTTSIRYNGMYGRQASTSSTESAHQRDEFTSWTFKKLWVQPDGATGGSGCLFTVRKNGADTSITGTSGTGSTVSAIDTSNSTNVVAGDELTLAGTGTVGSTSRTYVWAYTMFLSPAGGGPNPDVNDAVSVGEGVTARLTPLLASVNDAVTVAEHVDHGVHLYAETISVTEFVNVAVDALIASKSEALTVTDAVVVRMSVLAVHASDTVTVVEGPVNHNATGIGPGATPPPGILQDYWTVGIV